jgi:hypothetical protein
MLCKLHRSRPLITWLVLPIFLCFSTVGCIPSATSYANSFDPKVPNNVSREFAFKLSDVIVVDSSGLGYENNSRPVKAMKERMDQRFDPRFIDRDEGLTIYILYNEKRLKTRIVPDMIPYGFPLKFPLFNAIWPSVRTKRYDIKADVEILNPDRDVLHTFTCEMRATRKDQTGILLGVLFVTLFPVRGQYGSGSRLAAFYRHEAMSRLIVMELQKPAIAQKLQKAYQDYQAKNPN